MTPPQAARILIATANPGKMREIAAVFVELPIQCLGLADLTPLPEPVEDQPTFLGNAEKKARHYAGLTGLWTLADDSGIEVDALGGRPGVRSARYAGQPTDDHANNRKLVAELDGIPPNERAARFRCALVLADDDRILARTQGVIEGTIIDEPRGRNGFGYDPHFLLEELGMTTAEITPDHKNRISHRGQAARRMAPHVARLIGDFPE